MLKGKKGGIDDGLLNKSSTIQVMTGKLHSTKQHKHRKLLLTSSLQKDCCVDNVANQNSSHCKPWLKSPPTSTRNDDALEMLNKSKTKPKMPISDLKPSLKPSSKSLNKNDCMDPTHFTTATTRYLCNQKKFVGVRNVLILVNSILKQKMGCMSFWINELMKINFLTYQSLE